MSAQGAFGLFDPLPELVHTRTQSEYRAYRDGCHSRHTYYWKDSHPNPYKTDTVEHAAWQRGWDEATPYAQRGETMQKNGGGGDL